MCQLEINLAQRKKSKVILMLEKRYKHFFYKRKANLMLIQKNLCLLIQLLKVGHICLTSQLPVRLSNGNMKSKTLTYFHTLKNSYRFLTGQIRLVFKGGVTVTLNFP